MIPNWNFVTRSPILPAAPIRTSKTSPSQVSCAFLLRGLVSARSAAVGQRRIVFNSSAFFAGSLAPVSGALVNKIRFWFQLVLPSGISVKAFRNRFG
jgi:hypothetical protein